MDCHISSTSKRKREDSPPRRTITKQNKLQVDRPPISEAPRPRFSPRIKKRTAPSARVTSSPTKLNPISNSESEEDNDKKSGPNNDWAGASANSIATSDAIHKCTKCTKSFFRKCNLTHHIARFHGGIPCIAPSCTATLRSAKERDLHLPRDSTGCPRRFVRFSMPNL